MNDYRDDEKGKPSIVAIVAIVAVILVLGYFATTRTIGRFNEPPKENITFGLNSPYPPFESKVGDEYFGFDVDLAYKIGEKMNKKVIIKDFSDFGTILPALETGAIDAAISAITITDERKGVADFSVPYFNASQALLVLKDSKFKASGSISANDFAGMKIGYQEKTTSQGWAEENLFGKVNLAENKTFGDLNGGLQLLRFGVIDGIIMDEPSAYAFARSYPDLKVAGVMQTNEAYGVAVKKGDPQKLLKEIDQVIGEMKQNGEYDQLIKKHFGGGKS